LIKSKHKSIIKVTIVQNIFQKTTRWFTKKGRKISCLFSFLAR